MILHSEPSTQTPKPETRDAKPANVGVFICGCGDQVSSILDTQGLVEPTSQGAAIASVWSEENGDGSSWLDLVGGSAHNIDHTTINQRYVERFVDLVTATG